MNVLAQILCRFVGIQTLQEMQHRPGILAWDQEKCPDLRGSCNAYVLHRGVPVRLLGSLEGGQIKGSPMYYSTFRIEAGASLFQTRLTRVIHVTRQILTTVQTPNP